VLSGANTYSGQTDIQAGTLVIEHSSALGAAGHTTPTMTNIRDGATLALKGGISSAEHFHVWGSGVEGQGAIRNLSGDNALTNTDNGGPGYALRSDTTVGVDAGSLSISGFYESGGSYGLTKVGNGTLTIDVASTYTGKTVVNAGRLVLGKSSSNYDAKSSGYEINNGSTLALAGTFFALNETGGAARTITFGSSGGNTLDTGTGVNVVDWVGNTYKTTGGARNFITGSSGLNINEGLTANLDVARGTDATSDLTVSSFFWNTGGITKTGNGIATLTGNSTYSGETSINAGTLVAASNNALGAGGFLSTTKTTVANGATLALEGGITMDEHLHVSGSGVDGQGAIRNISGNNTLTSIGHSLRANTTVGVDAGRLSISGFYEEGGSFGLTKVGAGTLTLTGTNTYTGDTTVSGGELKVNGSIASSDVTVNSGAVLSGSGQVGGISGAGSINPGNSPGILAAPWIDPSEGMFFTFEITGIKPEYSQPTNSTNDVLRLYSSTPFAGAMDGDNAINVYFNMDDFDLNKAYQGGFYTDQSDDFIAMISGANFNYFLKDENGAVSYNGVSYSAMSVGFDLSTELETADFGSGAVSGRIMQFVGVPEPSSALLAAIGSLFLLRRRRKA
jgi:fibronectin-binding autotransporter adhesin